VGGEQRHCPRRPGAAARHLALGAGGSSGVDAKWAQRLPQVRGIGGEGRRLGLWPGTKSHRPPPLPLRRRRQEALDGIEFISGPASSRWGAVRAAMGRPQPWTLNFLAIGNEVGGWKKGLSELALQGVVDAAAGVLAAVRAAFRKCLLLTPRRQGCGLPWDPPNPNYRPFYWQVGCCWGGGPGERPSRG
jgi:alpha-L-arabinofuranosidase